MKRKALFLCVFTALVLGLNATIPAFAVSPPIPWGTLPLTDPADDVYQYTTNPSSGVQGNYHDEIDIVSISLVTIIETNLTIEFCAKPLQDANHVYTIYFDTDGDDATAEYYLVTYLPSGGFVLKNATGHNWNGAEFAGPNSVFYSTAIVGFTLILINISHPIPSYLSMRIAVIVEYRTEDPNLYLDYAPNPDASGGSLLFLLILFPLIGLGIALVIIYLRRDVIFD